jgi:ABC-type polar amino acid transport system ATPase subunit
MTTSPASAPSTAAVQMAGINKWYGAYHALRDIDLQVASGERIVICGPSGSGKSTLVRTVNLLEPFQQGRLRVCGVEVGADEITRATRLAVSRASAWCSSSSTCSRT